MISRHNISSWRELHTIGFLKKNQNPIQAESLVKMKLLFKWAKGKHRPTVRRYKSTKPSLNFSLLDYYSTLTGSILTWLTMIYFSSLGTLEHSRSRTKNTSNKQWRWIMALIPYLKIFPTKIVKNMILKNTRVSISEKGIDCVLL